MEERGIIDDSKALELRTLINGVIINCGGKTAGARQLWGEVERILKLSHLSGDVE